MNRMFKYVLRITDVQYLDLPEGSQILTAQVQYGEIVMWASVPTDVIPQKRRKIHIIGTGHPMPDVENLGYLSTVQLEGGALVFHIFIES